MHKASLQIKFSSSPQRANKATVYPRLLGVERYLITEMQMQGGGGGIQLALRERGHLVTPCAGYKLCFRENRLTLRKYPQRAVSKPSSAATAPNILQHTLCKHLLPLIAFYDDKYTHCKNATVRVPPTHEA